MLCNMSLSLSFFYYFLFFIFYLLFIYYVYFWLCWVLVSVWGLSPAAASGGHSSSRCAGLSLSRPLLLRSRGSRRSGSVVVAHGPNRSAACGILPDQGSNPCPLPALAGRFSTTAPPGKPLEPILQPIVCTSHSPTPILPLPPLPTGNHWCVLWVYICESASFLLYSQVCCIFEIPHINDIIQYLSFSVWLISISKMPEENRFLLSLCK